MATVPRTKSRARCTFALCDLVVRKSIYSDRWVPFSALEMLQDSRIDKLDRK
jgi:hypothetical protein